MNELILKITNIAVNYPNQLSKFYAISKVNDKIDWKLFVKAIEEYLEFNYHSSSPIINVFTDVLNEVNNYFCKLIAIYDYDGSAYEKIEQLCVKEEIAWDLLVDDLSVKNPVKRFFSWIKNMFVEKSEDAIEVKDNLDILGGKTINLIPFV